MRRILLALLTTSCILFSSSLAAYDCCCSRWDNAPDVPSACACNDESSFYAFGDVLFWVPCRSDLDYVITGQTDGVVYTDANVHYLDPDFDAGFRIGAGYCGGCDGWDYHFRWTHFDADTTNTASAPTTGVAPRAIPTRMHAASPGGNGDRANATFEVDYDVVDFLSGRPHFISCSLLIRPFAGLRLMWLDQDFNATYAGAPNFIPRASSSQWHSEYEGLGFHGGAESSKDLFEFCGGRITTFGRVAFSLISGRNEAFTKQIQGGAAQTTVVTLTDHEDCVILCGMEAAGGITYEGVLDSCGCCTGIQITIGGETVKWSNAPTQRRGIDDTEPGVHTTGSGGVLGFNGFFMSATLNF